MSDASLPPPAPGRRKFLVVVDHTPECRVAARFASRRAQHTGGLVTLVCVVAPADFQQWAGVERAMREESHQEAERLLNEAAKLVNEVAGVMPELVIREGRTAEEVRKLIKEDPAISILVLAAGTSKEGPGPLVSQVAGPASAAYSIPVTVVPGNLSDEAIDALA
jgi:nucleotide-binding universal stress UspA family protein